MHQNKIYPLCVNIYKRDTSPKQTHQDGNQQRLSSCIFASQEQKLVMEPTSMTPKLQEMFYWQTPGKSFMTWETHLKLQDSISRNINAVFSEILFLQEQPGFAANRKRSLRRKAQPRHRFMVTAALAYSTTHSVTLP